MVSQISGVGILNAEYSTVVCTTLTVSNSVLFFNMLIKFGGLNNAM